MKLVYCIPGTCHSGGMERVLANKANYLVAHGYEVVIVTTDQRGEKPFFPLDSRIVCHDLNIGYEENNGSSIWKKLCQYPLKQMRHRKKLAAILKSEYPDVVISMFGHEVSFLPQLRDGSRKVLEIHFSKFKRLQYGRKGLWHWADVWRSRQDEKYVRRFDRFVVLTEEDKSYWGNLPNITVIPNARTFYPERPAALENKRVIAVGRYTYQKGFERLLAAWVEVNRVFPDWKLDIIGDGEERDKLQKQVDMTGLSDSVTLSMPTGHIEQVYQEASIVALSSRYEGLPMILLEAQAYGLPIVAFRCKCGPADIIDNGVNGILIPEGDVHGLAEGIKTLITDETLRKQMGACAREASTRYSEEVVMRKWTELFSSLEKR